MVNWTTVNVSFPDLADCNDDEMEALLRFRDGRWSAPVKAAQARFGTTGLDLDRNWAGTPIFWTCPGCGRGKADLFRVNQAGILLARLDVHHDHLEDYIKDQLRQRFGQEWTQKIPSDTHHIETLGSTLVRRFAATIMCIDCNAADGAAKNRIGGIHPHFSFRPNEIAAFTVVTPNQPHQVDAAKALQIWQSVQSEFQQRLILADLLVEKICDGALTCPRTSIPLLDRGTDLSPLYFLHEWFGRTAQDGATIVQQRIDQIWARSLARDGTATRSKAPAVQKSPEPPTEQEVLDYDGGNSPKLWARADASWRCPVCERSKSNVLRRSNNRKRRWSGSIHEHHEYTPFWDGPDVEDEAGNSELLIDHHRELLICSDCAAVKAEVKRRDATLSGVTSLLQVHDLKAVISTRPNSPHTVDWPSAIAHTKSREAWRPAVESYWNLYHLALSCRSIMIEVLKTHPSPTCAMDRLVSLHRDQYPGWSDAKIAGHLNFLLEEADRLAPEEAGE